MTESNPVVACIPAYDEERTMGAVLVRVLRYVDRVAVCDDGSGDLSGEIAGVAGGGGCAAQAEHGCLMATNLRQNV